MNGASALPWASLCLSSASSDYAGNLYNAAAAAPRSPNMLLLQYLRAIGQALSPLGPQVVFYLAAAVSDFYLPWSELVRAPQLAVPAPVSWCMGVLLAAAEHEQGLSLMRVWQLLSELVPYDAWVGAMPVLVCGTYNLMRAAPVLSHSVGCGMLLLLLLQAEHKIQSADGPLLLQLHKVRAASSWAHPGRA